MGFSSRAIVAGVLGVAAALAVGCGSSGGGGLLSTSQSNDLTGKLDQVMAAVSSRNCFEVDNTVAHLNRSIQRMTSINRSLQNNLFQGVSTVGALAVANCAGIYYHPPAPATGTKTTATSTTPTTSTATSTATGTTSTPTGTISTPTGTTSTPTGTTSTPTGTISTPTGTSSTPATTTSTSTGPSGGTGLGTGTTTG